MRSYLSENRHLYINPRFVSCCRGTGKLKAHYLTNTEADSDVGVSFYGEFVNVTLSLLQVSKLFLDLSKLFLNLTLAQCVQ